MQRITSKAAHPTQALSDLDRSKLLDAAKKAAEKAYAPYSNFKVGAAVMTEDGNVYSGCNVENSSYGLTMCAERAAIFATVTAEGGGATRIKAIAVVSEGESPCSPCGACRQVISEFGSNIGVIFRGEQGIAETANSELLPKAFHL